LTKTGISLVALLTISHWTSLCIIMHDLQQNTLLYFTNGLCTSLYLMCYAYSTYIRHAPLPDHLPLTECVKCTHV